MVCPAQPEAGIDADTVIKACRPCVCHITINVSFKHNLSTHWWENNSPGLLFFFLLFFFGPFELMNTFKKSNFRVQQSLPRVHSLLFSLEFKEFLNQILPNTDFSQGQLSLQKSTSREPTTSLLSPFRVKDSQACSSNKELFPCPRWGQDSHGRSRQCHESPQAGRGTIPNFSAR